jgi:LysM repeat protein
MRRYSSLLFLVLFLFGCTTTKTVQEGSPPNPKSEAMKVLAHDIRQGLEALDHKDDVKASESFIKAFRELRAFDDEGKAIVGSASENLKNVVEISGFEYAKKESFSLLLMYQDMLKAYMDNDAKTLHSLSLSFNAAYQDIQAKTASEKQKRIEELDTEITQKRDELQKPSDSTPAVPETIPAIYAVKKGDTLPSIASKHEIYNDSYMWPLIYKANRDQIKDPKVLYAGQELKIPREMTTEEIIEARRESGAPDPEKIPKDAYIPKGKKK